MGANNKDDYVEGGRINVNNMLLSIGGSSLLLKLKRFWEQLNKQHEKNTFFDSKGWW